MDIKKLSIKKFIAITDILEANFYRTEVDRDIALLSCITEKSEDFFLNLDMGSFKEYKKLLAEISLDNIEPKPAKYIKANGKVYAPVFDFTKLTGGQFVDVVSFIKDPKQIIENLPKIMASFCLPTKKTLFGRRKLKYMEIPHDQVALDMEEASIFDAYSIAVFFWAVWKGSLEITGDSLVREVIAKKKATGTTITKMEARGLLNILEMYGDGITARKTFQRSKA